MVMDIERHVISRPEGRMYRSSYWSDISPAQAGVAAALRRAFALPEDETERQFEALLEKI
jgi:hypothetical protein